MKKIKYEEILESCPMNYIFGNIKKNSEGKKLILIEDSTLKFLIGSYLHDVINETYSSNEEFKKKCFKCIDIALDTGEYVGTNLSVKINDKHIYIWFNKNSLKKTYNLEVTLKKEKDMLDLFLDSLTDYVFFKDINGKYINCNKAFTEKVGVSKENIIGKDDREVFFDNLYKANKFLSTDKAVIKNKEKMVFSENWGDFSDYEFIEETVKAPYFDENNEMKGIVGITRDISYKRAIENRVKRNDKLFFEVLNYLDDVVIIKEGEKTVYVNDAFEKLYGVNCKEVYNERSMLVKLDMIHPDDRELFENINFKKFFSAKARIIRSDNEIRIVWFRANSIKDKEGNVIRRIIIINDITDSLNEEEELERLRMDFFANISHEFRTPVNLISSMLQMLEFKLNKNNELYEGEYKQYIDIGKQNIFRLLKLINNLIDSTKLKAGFFDCNMKNHNIVSCVEDVTLSLCNFAEDNKISIIFDTEKEEEVIAMDIDQIERVILNLLSNAIKFNKENGSIWVYINSEKDYVNISIKDTGIGIPKDQIPSLFHRFKIINNRFTKINEGSGVGLFIVKQLIDIHGGKIEVKSELGEGTEFKISLPLKQVDNKASKEVAATTYYNNKKDKIKIELSDIYTP